MKKRKYKSTLEASVAKQLAEYKIHFTYESCRLLYTIPSSTHYYTPDFNTHPYLKLECKGVGPRYGLTKECKQKMLLVKEQFPEIEIRFIFWDSNAITGNGKGRSKITYGEWAKLNGFKYSHKTIPEEWISDLQHK